MAGKDRISEIKSHLEAAEELERKASPHMWEAARLVWEEVESGTSRRSLGQSIGKSHTHVRYLYNCWDIVGLSHPGTKPGDLPSFNEVYHSVEVRGEPAEGEAGDGSGRRLREAPDHTAHGHVMAAAEAIDALVRNPAYWPLLSEDDWVVLRELPAVIDGLLTDSGRLCANRVSGRLVPNRLSCLFTVTAYRFIRPLITDRLCG